MIYLDNLAQFLDRFFAVHRYSQEERGGVYLPSTRRVKRLGLALEPWAQLPQWVEKQRLDALFLHRPWKLQLEAAEDIGVVSYHLAFDERLTLSFNPRLASVLAMTNVFLLGEKQGRAIGMIGDVPTQDFTSYHSYINQVFGGLEKACIGNKTEVSRIAVVGAMSDALVREADVRGADLYVTGQLRQPAEIATVETGIGVIAVGHRRSEEWGLKAIAHVLRERWYELEVVLPALLQ